MISFKQLTPPDYITYRHYFKNQRYQLCAYSLSSIIAWTNSEYKPFGAEYEDALVVAAEFETQKNNRHLLLPVSPQRMFAPDELETVARAAGHTEYWFVPGDYVDHFGQETIKRHFRVQHQGAYDDYVYRAEDLAELKGNRYSKKRNLINQFQRDYVDPGKVAIDPIGADNAEECLIFLEEWCRERDCDADDQMDLACEKQAAINTLLNYDAFDLKGLLLRVDGQVNAFGISAPLTADMATLQYEKALASIKGLYQYFDNACARLLVNGYTYLNKESDMGVPGLAKAKKSYYPHKMVRSVRLILKN
ncbi:MAG: phosphatidylglycerol lysyltransferase domain-containing protein [Desulfosarcina sp.]